MPADSLSDSSILLRFGFALALSFAFGLARQKLGKPIGFGTFIFLGLGSCALSLTAMRFTPDNPLPLLGAAVTGIGFLGAGALFRTADRIVGFTSAATIWIFSVFGLAVGAGEVLIAGLLYGSIWAVIAIDRVLEQRALGAYQRRLRVDVDAGTADAELAAELGLPPRAQALSLRLDRKENRLTLTYTLRGSEHAGPTLAERLQASPRVQGFDLE